MSICHCAKCHREFTGARGFDLHQSLTPDGIICRDPAAMTRRDGRALYVLSRGRWAVNARGQGQPARWRGTRAPAPA